MRVDDRKCLERLQRLVVNGELFFATPHVFNDPFDCAIAPSFEASPEAIREYVRDLLTRRGRNPVDPNEVEEMVARSTSEDFRQNVRQQYLELIGTYGITCFAATPTNLLMWSYYAAGHTGVVVGIDTLTLMQQRLGAPLFPLDVEYARDCPVVNYYTDDDFEIARKTLATKAEAWRHEEEWRWILVGKSGVVHLAPGTVNTIIFGLRTAGDVEQTIRRWIAEEHLRIDLTRMKYSENSFVLETSPA